MDSLILQTAIGLVFVFATGAALVSVGTEAISRYVGLRSEYLLRGIRTLLDGGGDFKIPLREAVTGRLSKARQPAANASGEAWVAKIMAHPLVNATNHGGQPLARAGDAPLTNKQRRRLPSYLSGRSFARALVDVVVPDANGATNLTGLRNGIVAADLPPNLKKSLLSLLDDGVTDIAQFRTNVEHWYDDEMARVSGWYKRHTRWVSLALGVVVVVLFNLNVLTIARSIYTDQAVRGSVVTEASRAAHCTTGPADCLRQLRADISSVRGAGLPVGWGTVPACTAPDVSCNWFESRGLWVAHGKAWLNQLGELGLILLGWALLVLALLPGANFWFDILGRLGTLRNTGPKPKTA